MIGSCYFNDKICWAAAFVLFSFSGGYGRIKFYRIHKPPAMLVSLKKL